MLTENLKEGDYVYVNVEFNGGYITAKGFVRHCMEIKLVDIGDDLSLNYGVSLEQSTQLKHYDYNADS